MPKIIITNSDHVATSYRFDLTYPSVDIGRNADNDIVIDSGSISGLHAQMRRIQGGYELHDMNSTNGILASGVRLKTIQLQAGMLLNIGDALFEFLLTEEELEALKAEKAIAIPTPRVAVAAARPANHLPQKRTESSISSGALISFAILALISFFIGLHLRHKKETGESLLTFMLVKKSQGENVQPSKNNKE